MNVILFDTPALRMQGLQNMSPVPEGCLFVFTDITQGMVFHSKNVLEPFDIVFLDQRGHVLRQVDTLIPTGATVTSPERTAYAIESKEGILTSMNLDEGKKMNLDKLLGKAT